MRSSGSLDLHHSSLAQISEEIRQQKTSVVTLVQESLRRIEHLNPRLNAFITVTADQAMEQAIRAAAEIKKGDWKGPLHGIPVGVKDFFDTAGIKTTGACEQFRERVPGKDAEVVTKLKQAGAIIIGKTNMHVLGMGTTSVESCFGPVHNPWKAEYVAGGSSGGSAAAVAAGLCYFTVDTDAVGSCRLPAACCGVTGFKPTFGLLSTQGILEGEPVNAEIARAVAYLGHTALTCRSAEDASIVLCVLANCQSSQSECEDGDAARFENNAGARIGVARNYKGTREVRSALGQGVEVLRSLGHSITELDAPLDSPDFSLRNIEADRKAIQESLFRAIDFLMLPTLTGAAPTIAEVKNSGQAQAVSSHNTFFCNYYGFPAVSLPCGFNRDGLPLAFQVVGRRGEDVAVLSLARSYQRKTAWHCESPSIL
jgi:aspartyl-tRNA(Asn)/glutamyl-tRNA(Gln) amidotransferase subunit A